MANNLNIFRASAGSGKTHKLTGFFLELMFNENINFNEILAVTFTNKATAEMKERIIKELSKLANQPEKSDYIDKLTQNGKRSINYIKKDAEDRLAKILNDYADLNISTIDSFFQRIVRDLARELNVAGGLEVELDNKVAIQEAVKRFLASLNEKENREKLNWMIDYSNHIIDKGSGWDFRNDLFELAKSMLNSEDFKQYRNELEEFASNREYIKEYSDRLKAIVQTWKSDLKSAAEQTLKEIKDMNITVNDFSYGSSSGLGILNNWANNEFSSELPKRFKEKAEDKDKWFPKPKKGQTNPDSPKLQELLQLCVKLADDNSERYRNYITAVQILDNFHQLCIMADLDRHMKDYCDEEGIMILSSTPELLARLVNDDDAPFIYEKIGTKLKSYMIDEFQDTSKLQWTNFRPLLIDALGQGTQNLIVGDVKQSIYRWRGGDWRLLDHGVLMFKPEQQEVNDNDLRCNYRSEAAIVQFNNTFFESIAKSLDNICKTTQVSRIYDKVAQEFSPNLGKFASDGATRPGLVDIILFDVQKNEKDIDVAMSMLPEQVRKLQEQGYALRDIAVLCRRNKEGQAAAEALLQSGISIISNEALVISSRPVIQAIISQLEMINEPQSVVNKAVAEYNMEVIEADCTQTTQAEASLYEVCQSIINTIPSQLLENEKPFIEAFLDLVLEYTSKSNGSLSAFLDWWEQTGKDKSIATSEEQDAVSIMTIHKSKGLGMPAIIVPMANWNMDIDTSKRNKLVWCEPKQDPFITPCKVHLPMSINKDLEKTIFAEEYAEERLCSIIDNVNTAYVAFTRAKQTLVIMAPKPTDKKESTKLNVFLSDYTGGESKSYGTLEGVKVPVHKTLAPETAKNKTVSDGASIMSTQLPELVLRHENTNAARERGNMIHRALQDVTDIETMPEAIHRLYHCEVLREEDMPESEMLELLTEKLSQPTISPWFKSGIKVKNEMSLIDKDGSVHRPDRVIIDDNKVTVIDYKTGGDHKGYRPQVSRYMRILKQMGFTNVSGYLWFIETDNIVEVQMYNKPRQTEIEWSFE